MQSVAVDLGERGLSLKLPDGRAQYVNYLWLRDNCPTSWDPQTRDRTFDITTIASDLKARSARIDGDALVVHWSDDSPVSRFDLDWLLGWLRQPGQPDVAALEMRPWRSEKTGRVARFAFDEILSDWSARCRYLETLMADGLVLIHDVPDDSGSVTRIAEVAGIVRGGFSGQYFNVRAYPKPAGAAYTANALEPHTDNPCEEFPPGVQYLHCLLNEAQGGQSTFADGLAAAMDLKALDPQGFALLAGEDVPFRFSHDGIDMRARQKVILTDRQGQVTGVTVSQHMADIFDLDQRMLDAYYPAFIRFLQMLRAPDYEITLTLKSGECVVFDNQRIVHGRRAYDPTSGARILRGCYSDRGEMRSRYRALRRDGAIRDHKPQGAD
jgi:gamma-butyrobetaine dioxygenase